MTTDLKSNPTLIGLTGFAGSGKDTVADILVEDHGFAKFSFSDALYREVSASFGVSEIVLRDRETKEKPLECLSLIQCDDADFIATTWIKDGSPTGIAAFLSRSRSPRDILQLWGTEYRRTQDPDYWVKRAKEWASQPFYDSCAGLVNTSVRFENEAAWIASEGEVWCVRRPGHGAINGHISEKEQPHSRIIRNRGGIEDLRHFIRSIM